MQDIWIKKIGEHRGAPRVFLDAAQAIRAGFSPGDRYEVQVADGKVVLSKNADGSRTVSARRRGDEQLPVVDINSKELLALFEGMSAVRVVVGRDRVYLLPLASELKKRERLTRLVRKAGAGEPLAIGSLSHGGGVLSHAIHQGLQDAGVECELVFANELREDLLAHAIERNDAWKGGQADAAPPPGAIGEIARTAALAVPMQELAQDDWLMEQLPKLEILEMGLPCSGASKAGKSKRGLEKMEDHPEVGHLAFSALMILSKTQPAVVLLENVTDYASSASAQILRHQLRDMGYDLHEAILEGKDFGSLENRVRWCMVAVTRGVEFDFERIAPAVRILRRVEEILDPVAPDDPRWSSFDYLHTKRERDEAKGNGFRMQFIAPEDTSVPTLRKGYHKAGSTDPLLKHPVLEGIYRKLTAGEHARAKGVPPHLVEGLSETTAHELLGQGIVYEPFRAVGERIGEAIAVAIEAGQRRLRAADDDAVAAARERRQRATG